MASVTRRASLLVEFIFHFVRFSIFETVGSWIETRIQGKSKVTELQRKPSTANEEDFLDICSSAAAFNRFSLNKDEGKTFAVGKTLPKKNKKKRFGNNKVSPIERLAWENNEAKNAGGKKSRAPSLFTSRSSKASIMKKDFEKPCYNDKKDRRFLRATSSSQGEKKKAHIPEQPEGDSSFGPKASQTKRNKMGEVVQKPGTKWRLYGNNVKDPNSGSVNQKDNSALPSGLGSKVPFKWKGLYGNKRGKKAEKSTRESVAVSDANKNGLNPSSGFRSKVASTMNGFKKQAKSPKPKSNLQDCDVLHAGSSNACANEHLHVQSARRFKITFKWKFRGKKREKTGKTGIGELQLGLQKLQKNLDRPTSLRSKISFKWRNLHAGKEDKLQKEESWTEDQNIEPATIDMAGKSGISELNEKVKKAARLSKLLSRFKR